MYAPLSSLAGSSLPRRGPAARLAAAVIGRAVLLATPVLFLVTGLPLLLTQGDATSRGDGPTHPGGPGLGAASVGSAMADRAEIITTGIAPAVPWLAAAVVIMAFYLGHRLYREGRRRSDQLPVEADSSCCRTWYTLAVGLVGLAALEVAVGGWAGVPEPALTTAVDLTVIAAGTAFLAALLTTPATVGAWTRLRLLVDGAVVGLCLTFCGWALLVAPLEPAELPALLIVFCCCVVATALVSAADPWRPGNGPVLCAAAVGGAMAGLLGLSFALAHPVPGWWLAAVTTLLLAAPVLGWCGVSALLAGDSASASPLPRQRSTTPTDASAGSADAARADTVRAGPVAAGTVSAGPADKASTTTVPTNTVPTNTVPTNTVPTNTVRAGTAHEASAETVSADAATSTADARWVDKNVIAWPAALAVAVAVYQVAVGAGIDRASAVLGTLAGVGVGTRYLLLRLVPSPWGRTRPSGPAADGLEAPAVPRPRAGDHATQPPVHTDPVTGLADPTQLTWSITAMRSAPRSPGALLLIGIDGLDTLPPTCHDDVVREVATRLRRFVAADERDRTSLADLPARWSAAELALLTPANLAQAYGLAHRVLTVLADPVAVPGGTSRLSVCVGVTDLAGAASTEDAVRRAQVALRRAQQLGPGRVEWYDPAVAEAVARREVLERDLPEAMRRGELDLIYQPILDLERGRPLAVEALLRWRHPRFGTLLPADVIPIAEETGAIVDVDRWALWRALVRLAMWRQEDRDLSMAINVSPHTLATPTFADEVAAALAAYDLPPNRLVVEVAEAEIEDGVAVDEGVAALRAIGVRTALDAFGTGVASLTHLRRLPIDMVKIGKPFFEKPVGSGPGSDAGTPMIELMVGVGRRLGVDVVAQGVEAPAHLTVVRSAGCRIGQGHLFARPQPAEQTEAYLDGFVVRS